MTYEFSGNMIVSPTFGAFWKYDLDRLNFSVEGNFNRKGTKNDAFFTDEFGNIITNAKVVEQFNYFEVPLLVGFYPVQETRLNVYAGFAPCFLIKGKYKYIGADAFGVDDQEMTGAKKFNLDLIIGSSFEYDFSDLLYAGFDMRYGKSLLSCSEFTDEYKYYYVSFTLRLGYKLDF